MYPFRVLHKGRECKLSYVEPVWTEFDQFIELIVTNNQYNTKLIKYSGCIKEDALEGPDPVQIIFTNLYIWFT
jgi:hypothetical protein